MNIKKKHLEKLIENFLFEVSISDLGSQEVDFDAADMAAIKDEKVKKALTDNPPEITGVKNRAVYQTDAYDEKLGSSFYQGKGFDKQGEGGTRKKSFALTGYKLKIPIVGEKGEVKEEIKTMLFVAHVAKKAIASDGEGKLIIAIKGGEGKLVRVEDYIEKNYKDDPGAKAAWVNAVGLVTKKRMKQLK